MSHETLNIYHQLLGRVITILLYLHAVFYLIFYIQKDLLAAKVQEFYVICGIVGVIAFTAVGTTALAPVRQWSYRAFYITHVVLATALLPILFFHVSHIRIYLYETAAIYAVNITLRAANSRTVSANISRISGTNILKIALPSSLSPKLKTGQHIYLSLPSHPLSRRFRSNPFTIASLPTDKSVDVYARTLAGNTATLAKHTDNQNLTVEGPYGLTTHGTRLLKYDRVLFVAGGIGGTFIVPLYRELLADLSPSAGSYRRSKVEFIWTVRTIAEVNWALPESRTEREGFTERLRVFVTGGRPYEAAEEGVELEERKDLASSFEDEDAGQGEMSVVNGRPDLAKIVDGTFLHGSSERVAVFVCGPKSLTRSLRKEVGKWVKREGREVWFWEESFGL